jgi:hypothetical protein
MLRSLVLASFLLVTSSIVACGSDDDGPGVDAGVDAGGDAGVDAGSDAGVVPGELSDYCRPLALQICESAESCGCGEVFPSGALDVEACAARFEVTCLESWQPLVAAGAVVDGLAAAECARLVEEATVECAAPSGLAAFAVCAPFVVEPVAIGEACSTIYCANGEGFCRREEGPTGICTTRGAEGEACSDMFSCATGLACDGERCARLAEVGEACTQPSGCRPPAQCVGGRCELLRAVDGACEDTTQCAFGSVCVAGRCAERAAPTCDDVEAPCGNLTTCGRLSACRAPADVGEACVENADCRAELFCADDSKTCATRPAEGASCGNGVICGVGLGCDADGGSGTCAALPTSGEPCLFGERGPFLCAEGLACRDGVCGALPNEGEACAGLDTCAAGLGCSFEATGSVCVVPRGAGEPCQNNQACRADHHCAPSGSCAPDVAPGETCVLGAGDCAGACTLGDDGGFVCLAERLSDGDRCADDGDCADGLTCRARAEDSRCVAQVCSSVL